MGKLFFVGDSITAGMWDEQGGWANRLIGKIMALNLKAGFSEGSFYCAPYNLGISGNMVSDVLTRIEQEIGHRMDAQGPTEKVQIVYALGVNDSQISLPQQTPMVQTRHFIKNLEELIKRSQRLASRISFLGLLPVDESRVNPMPWALDRAYTNERVREFEKILIDTCRSYEVEVLPLFETWFDLPNYASYLMDGVHPSTKGHALLAGQVSQFLITEEFLRFHANRV